VIIFVGSTKHIRHNINECENVRQKMIQMMTCGLLQIEKEEKDDVVSMLSFKEKRKQRCVGLIRLVITYSGVHFLIIIEILPMLRVKLLCFILKLMD